MNGIVLAGVVACFYGTSSYLKEMFRGEARPNRITWFFWALSPLIGAVAAFAQGITWNAMPVFASGFCPLLVFIASFFVKSAYWKLERGDWFCGLFAGIGLVLWQITKNPALAPNLAIGFAVLSDGCAALPTLRKAYLSPASEDPVNYACGVFTGLTCFSALESASFAEIAFPLYLVLMNTALAMSIYFGKSRKKVKSST